MLMRGHALPAELYAHIFSDLDRHDLVQVSQACRILFNVTIRYLWRVVDLRPLLALLPGSCMVSDPRGLLEPETPTLLMTSDDYYTRFRLYAPYVEVLETESGSYSCAPSKYFMDRRTYSSLRRIQLPNLKEVDMGHIWSGSGWASGGTYGKPSLFWMALLIPATIKGLSFTATDQRDLSLLGTLLARCTQLTQFKFRPDQRPNWDTWLSILAFHIPQEITNLEISCAEVNNAGYSWLSKLTKLQSLELLLCQSFGQLPQRNLRRTSDPSPVAYPHAFSTLRNLCISITHHSQLPQIIQICRTIAAHITHITIKAPGRIWTPDMFNGLFLGLTSHCLKLSFLHLHESGPQSYGADVPSFPISHLSVLQSLPLRALKISYQLSLIDDSNPLKYVATLFPNLEELWLEKTPIIIDELLEAKINFPHMCRLELGFHNLKPTHKFLSDTLGGADRYVDSNYAPQSTLALIPGLCLDRGSEDDRWWSYSVEDWDFAAKLLTSRWSSVYLDTSHGAEPLDRYFKINEKFDFYSAQRDKNRRRERD
ncbi:hypothetical protein B0J17DRAFT_640725 [Rhizoctonia solani]|nr:hypothetical protein B0J17DRAFT_640725 [Rhizoctonia solani]